MRIYMDVGQKSNEKGTHRFMAEYMLYVLVDIHASTVFFTVLLIDNIQRLKGSV